MKFRVWHAAVFLIALVVFAAARAPAALVAPQRPGIFTYESAEGTVWSARFADVRLGPYQAATATWRLSLADLVQGKAIADLSFAGGAIEGGARLLGNWHGDRRIVIDTLSIEGAPLGGALMLEGTTTLRGLDIHFADGRCTRAQGDVESDVLTRNAATLNGHGTVLTGTFACAGDAAQIVLEGASEGEPARILLELRANGEGGWRATQQTAKPKLQAALAAAGFTLNGDGDSMGASGEFQWLPF